MSRGVRAKEKVPKNISANERVKTYPDEGFIVRNSKLFCRACKEVLALKKSSIEYHIKYQKQISGKKKLTLKNKEESNILEALHVYDSRVHPVGDGLPDSTWVYRVKVVTTMLKAGVPLNKINLFRDLLEEHRLCPHKFNSSQAIDTLHTSGRVEQDKEGDSPAALVYHFWWHNSCLWSICHSLSLPHGWLGAEAVRWAAEASG